MKTLHSEMVGKHIKANMKYHGVTVANLADAAGIGHQSIWNILSGNMKGSVETIKAICVALKLNNPIELYKIQYIKG